MIKIKNANFVCTMKHVKLQNFDPEQIEFLARVSEQIGFFYIIYTPELWYLQTNNTCTKILANNDESKFQNNYFLKKLVLKHSHSLINYSEI